jgi:hypothetical protein
MMILKGRGDVWLREPSHIWRYASSRLADHQDAKAFLSFQLLHHGIRIKTYGDDGLMVFGLCR